MAKVDGGIASSIERFLAAVRLRKRVESAYLYGSYTSGRATEWSDIDLALISPDFSTDLFAERLALMRLAADIDDRIEPWPFRPEDFNENDPLANEIQKSGVSVQ